MPLNLLKIIPQESQEEMFSTNVSKEDGNKTSKYVQPKKEYVIEKDKEEPSNNKSTEKGLDQDQMKK